MLRRIVGAFGAAAVVALVGMLLIEAPIQAQTPGVVIEDALQTALEVPSTNAALIPQGMQEFVYRAVPSTASLPVEYEDPFLQAIYANGEVFGCTDDVGFSKLISATPIEELKGVCGVRPVEGTPQRLGVIFWEPPVFDSVEMFANGSFYDPEVDIKPSGKVAALKYVMETEHGTIRFVWPSPLHEEDYTMFSGPYEEKLELDLRLEPDPPAFLIEEPDLLGEPAHMMRASF